MQHLEGSGTPVLYIGRKVLKGQIKSCFQPNYFNLNLQIVFLFRYKEL